MRYVICTGIICLTAIECWAIYNGIDGTLLTAVVAIIAASLGVVIPTPQVIQKILKGG